MVYESDFYTTRRPYRPTPGYSTYTVTSTPSRQIRILPGLGKVHIVHTYDRIIPYVGHKRLTVVTLPPRIYATRPSVLQKEYDWIENKLRPWVAYSPLNRYLNSDSAMIFDSEARIIRAQTASLLKQIHLPTPRIRSWPITPLNRYGEVYSLPVKYSNDTYIHRLLTVAPNSKIQYATYYTEPVKKYIGQGHLSCVSYAGNKSYNRRRPLAIYEDTLRNDIHLLSYYINRFRQEKIHPKDDQVPLSASRPSRIFSVQKPIEDPVVQEIKDLREARAARLAKIYDTEEKPVSDVGKSLKAKNKKEEELLAEEKAFAEEQERKKAQAKKEEAARKAELARQEQLAAQAAAEHAAELERQAETARQEELAKQAELERIRQLEEEARRQEEEARRQEEEKRLEEERRQEEERIRLEEQKRREEEEEQRRAEEERIRIEEEKRLLEEAKAEEERQQLLRLEEIARQAEEEKERELARQAEELAEIARHEAQLAELERQQNEVENVQQPDEQTELESTAPATDDIGPEEVSTVEEAVPSSVNEETNLESTDEQPEDKIIVEEASDENEIDTTEKNIEPESETAASEE